MDECTLAEAAMEAASRMAKKIFRGDRDKESKVADAISVAWEFSQTAPPEATARSVATFAIRRTGGGRQFSQSCRSIDGPPARRTEKPARSNFDVAGFCRGGDDPALIVELRMDTETWLSGLRPREKRMAQLLAEGFRAVEVAALLGLSQVRISQIRDELEARWDAMQEGLRLET